MMLTARDTEDDGVVLELRDTIMIENTTYHFYISPLIPNKQM